ncbi:MULTISPECIES: helix-turn-helix domain-containing protein [Streptomyces]|uniref:helix-turn-helix domain-containing protein n=1 Tax=Streptomyces TaxID=1883 RepID=UPI0004C57A8A|nr:MULTISPECIES: helix-turn-helix transcriptional regulator [Streptomyces]NNG85219.1 helix-turn-helix domain-containing protein [Streptomyces cacaoi]QHF95860.1 XRE family transcriptional regulator [Streptomyces sp. NHF165]
MSARQAVPAQPERGGPFGRVPDHPRGGPTILRIVLGTQLRRLREAHGITREEAGEAIRGSHAKISRLELGRVGCKERDIADLLTLYEVWDPQEREEYLQLARQAGNPGWWQKYSDVMSPWFDRLIGMEEAASVIRTYEVQFIPGLLQTKNYAREVIRLGHPRDSEQQAERRIDLRMRRQDILHVQHGPRLWAVLDEAALRRPLGGHAVMREQIEHLIAVNRQSNVTLQIAPFSIGGLAAAGGPVTILRFSEPDLPDIVYLEQLSSSLYLEKREEVEGYMVVMDRLCAMAEPPGRTGLFLENLLNEM